MVLKWHEMFGTKRGFVDLCSDFFRDMRQARVVGYVGVRRIATENKLLHTKSFAGTKNRSHVVGRADVMGDDDDFGHTVIYFTLQSNSRFSFSNEPSYFL